MSVAEAKASLRTPPRRRRVNVETDAPAKPLYEVEGEKAYLANLLKNAGTSAEKKAKEATLVAMVNAKLPNESFSITVKLPNDGGERVVDFSIDRSDKEEVDIQKLYTMVLGKEISMEDFVSVCKASQGAIKDKFGTLVLAKCMVTVPNTDPGLKMAARK